MPELEVSTMPSASTRLTVTFLYSFPSMVLKSSARRVFVVRITELINKEIIALFSVCMGRIYSEVERPYSQNCTSKTRLKYSSWECFLWRLRLKFGWLTTFPFLDFLPDGPLTQMGRLGRYLVSFNKKN